MIATESEAEYAAYQQIEEEYAAKYASSPTTKKGWQVPDSIVIHSSLDCHVLRNSWRLKARVEKVPSGLWCSHCSPAQRPGGLR